MRNNTPRWLGRWLALLLLNGGLVHAAPRTATIASAMPQTGDFTLLSWREGPPYLGTSTKVDAADAGYSSARRFLRIQTGYFGVDVDTEKIALTGYATYAKPLDQNRGEAAVLQSAVLRAAALKLTIRLGGVDFVCTGRKPTELTARGVPKDALRFQVRVIETGRFFQKFGLYDLEFKNSEGKLLPVNASLEVSAWPDRLMFTLVTRPTATLGDAKVGIQLETALGKRSTECNPTTAWAAQHDDRTTLVIPADWSTKAAQVSDDIEIRVTPTDFVTSAAVKWDAEESAFGVKLESPPWPKPTEGVYPEAKLDAWEDCAVTVENHSATAHTVGLNFDYSPVKIIWSYVPMLLDAAGQPTGIPVQISKDWHAPAGGTDLPHAGAWMHGRTWLHVPPHSRLALRYGTTFARWGGVPTASGSQLSLIGYAHNGFWDQLALGGFGESVCFQPGRVMRRSLLTDFRPLFQKGMGKGDRWTWTSNVGGADTMVRLDPTGRYVPFKRNFTRYASYGPNLVHFVYGEVSADEAMASRTEVFLARTDDIVRVYFKIHYEVRRRVVFSHLALFQLGTDFYAGANAPAIAWGTAAGLTDEARPTLKTGERGAPVKLAAGERPWISLHGDTPLNFSESGQGTRGLVVRAWRAVLGGKGVPQPWFSAFTSEGRKPNLNAELVAPPGLTTLEPGDFVDMELEVSAVPFVADNYYGPNESLRAALKADANTWKMIHREAAHAPALRLADGTRLTGFPLTVSKARAGEHPFQLEGGLGWVPVRFAGLPAHDALTLFQMTPTGREKVVQGDPTRAWWQTDYDETTRTWTVTYNLPATDQPVDYIAVVSR